MDPQRVGALKKKCNIFLKKLAFNIKKTTFAAKEKTKLCIGRWNWLRI